MSLDYGKCPCGESLVPVRATGPGDWEMLEHEVPGFYRCSRLTDTQAGPNTLDAKFAVYLSAWVCLGGWMKIKLAKEAGRKEPPVNPQAVEATRVARAAARPSYVKTASGRMVEL